MDIKEEIHALSEEMLTNLGRLVAIDSQLGTPSEGNHLVRVLQKPWKRD
jgi:succinyl-diaminopimelate desuccinylase